MRALWITQLVLLAVWLTLRLRGGRAAAELRVRLLETLATAVRDGLALLPVVEGLALEVRGRLRPAVAQLATELEAGAPLHEALAAARGLRTPSATIAALRAAEGGPGFADVLAAAARAEAASLRDAHRARAAATYPVVLAVLAVVFLGPASAMTDKLRQVAASMEVEPSSPFAMPTWIVDAMGTDAADTILAGVVGVVVALFLFDAAWQRSGLAGASRIAGPGALLGRLPPWRGAARAAATSRWLDQAAAFLRAGLPFGESLRLAGAACGHGGVERNAVLMAERADAGAAVHEVWDRVDATPSERAQIASACTLDAPVAAAAMERCAANVRTRREAAVARRVAVLQFVVIACVALAVTSAAAEVFSILNAVRAQVPQW